MYTHHRETQVIVARELQHRYIVSYYTHEILNFCIFFSRHLLSSLSMTSDLFFYCLFCVFVNSLG